jgi:hypothetical protein
LSVACLVVTGPFTFVTSRAIVETTVAAVRITARSDRRQSSCVVGSLLLAYRLLTGKQVTWAQRLQRVWVDGRSSCKYVSNYLIFRQRTPERTRALRALETPTKNLLTSLQDCLGWLKPSRRLFAMCCHLGTLLDQQDKGSNTREQASREKQAEKVKTLTREESVCHSLSHSPHTPTSPSHSSRVVKRSRLRVTKIAS